MPFCSMNLSTSSEMWTSQALFSDSTSSTGVSYQFRKHEPQASRSLFSFFLVPVMPPSQFEFVSIGSYFTLGFRRSVFTNKYIYSYSRDPTHFLPIIQVFNIIIIICFKVQLYLQL